MGSNQLYSLSWGEFGSSLTSTVQVLRGHGELVDVTLAAGGRIFPAHKLVLSAASPLLMELLKSTHCQHPVVMLAGITAPDLEALLQFVYQGEVSVDPNQLPSLLQAAHCLDIQALSPATLTSEQTMTQTMVVGADDALSRDVANTLLPVRKRKRKQRRSSESISGVKWPNDGNVENRPLGVPGEDDMPSNSREDVMKDDSRSDHHCGDEGAAPPTPGKIRGTSASEQPCGCPLCGATIRQARNLRRHLITSCKYRMTNQLDSSSDSPELVECNPSPLPSPAPNHFLTPQPLPPNLFIPHSYSVKKLVSDLPAECTVCGVTLRQSRNLRRHMELIHLKVDGERIRKRRKQDGKSKTDEDGAVQTDENNPLSINETTDTVANNAGSSQGPRLPPPPPPPHMLTSPPPPPLAMYQTPHHNPTPQMPGPGPSTTLCDTMHTTFVPTHSLQFTHDNVFRQHQTELLRGAGLYADTRDHCHNE